MRADGTVIIPDGFSARGLPAVPRLDGVRAFLRERDAGSEEHHGFSPNTPVVLSFDAAIDLERATPDRLLLLEVAPGTSLPGVLDALGRERGLDRRTVVLGTVFPVEDITGQLDGIRQQIDARPPPAVDFIDTNPDDNRAFGIFHPGDSAFAAFFGGNPPIAGRRHGARQLPVSRLPGERTIPGELPRRQRRAARRAHRVPPGPAEAGHPAVPDRRDPARLRWRRHHRRAVRGRLHRGRPGADRDPAPDHGPRGNFLDFFDFDDFNAFGNNFRQNAVDLLALVRMLTNGLDIDGDGVPEIRQHDLGFLGQSLGGVVGGVYTPVDPNITFAVLNVPGGNLSQLAGASSPLAGPFLARFATQAGIPVQVCGGDPTATACSGAADCPAGVACLGNPDFAALLDAAGLDFQTQLDPGDGSCYGRRLRLEPQGVGPKPVLVQEGIGDMVVANPLTEALARAIALPANRADSAAGGVAGLWRFPPPQGHGILALPNVRAQAIGFLATAGTTLSP